MQIWTPIGVQKVTKNQVAVVHQLLDSYKDKYTILGGDLNMPKLKFKSYLITNIPERDWKKFKRWAAIMDYNNLNDANDIT